MSSCAFIQFYRSEYINDGISGGDPGNNQWMSPQLYYDFFGLETSHTAIMSEYDCDFDFSDASGEELSDVTAMRAVCIDGSTRLMASCFNDEGTSGIPPCDWDDSILNTLTCNHLGFTEVPSDFCFTTGTDACADSGTVSDVILGCTDSDALNYRPDATDDDGMCRYIEVCAGNKWPYDLEPVYHYDIMNPDNEYCNNGALWNQCTGNNQGQPRCCHGDPGEYGGCEQACIATCGFYNTFPKDSQVNSSNECDCQCVDIGDEFGVTELPLSWVSDEWDSEPTDVQIFDMHNAITNPSSSWPYYQPRRDNPELCGCFNPLNIHQGNGFTWNPDYYDASDDGFGQCDWTTTNYYDHNCVWGVDYDLGVGNVHGNPAATMKAADGSDGLWDWSSLCSGMIGGVQNGKNCSAKYDISWGGPSGNDTELGAWILDTYTSGDNITNVIRLVSIVLGVHNQSHGCSSWCAFDSIGSGMYKAPCGSLGFTTGGSGWSENADSVLNATHNQDGFIWSRNEDGVGTYGCTDPEACNYNPNAIADDFRCIYGDGECGGVCIESLGDLGCGCGNGPPAVECWNGEIVCNPHQCPEEYGMHNDLRGRYLIVFANDRYLKGHSGNSGAEFNTPGSEIPDEEAMMKTFSGNIWTDGTGIISWQNMMMQHPFLYGGSYDELPDCNSWTDGCWNFGPMQNSSYHEPVLIQSFTKYLKQRGYIVDIAVMNRTYEGWHNGTELLTPYDKLPKLTALPYVTEDWTINPDTGPEFGTAVEPFSSDDGPYTDLFDDSYAWTPACLHAHIHYYRNRYKLSGAPLKHVLFVGAPALVGGGVYTTGPVYPDNSLWEHKRTIPTWGIQSYTYGMPNITDYYYQTHTSELMMAACIENSGQSGCEYAALNTYGDVLGMCDVGVPQTTYFSQGSGYSGPGVTSSQWNQIRTWMHSQSDTTMIEALDDIHGGAFTLGRMPFGHDLSPVLGPSDRGSERSSIDLMAFSAVSHHHFGMNDIMNTSVCVSDAGGVPAAGQCEDWYLGNSGMDGDCIIPEEDAILAGCEFGTCWWFTEECSDFNYTKQLREYLGNSYHIGYNYAG